MSTFAAQKFALLYRLLVCRLVLNPRMVDDPLLLLFFFSFNQTVRVRIKCMLLRSLALTRGYRSTRMTSKVN